VDRDSVVMEGLQPPQEASATAVLARLEAYGVPALEHHCGPGEHVYVRGDADRGLCFLLEGTLRVYRAYDGFKEATIRVLSGGGLFEEPSLTSAERHRDSAEAAFLSRVARVPKGPLAEHLGRDSVCRYSMMLALAGWAEEREAAVARLLTRRVDGRLALLLVELMVRFGRRTGRGTEVGVRLPHQELARMVACERTAVSKEISRFRRAGLIEAHRGQGRIVVLDERGLREAARAGGARNTSLGRRRRRGCLGERREGDPC
jgi:CRP/FNR family transcriptional regulator